MIVVGITGGIAAYKAVGVVRGLVLAGHDVHVIATESALRFVGRPTLEAISRNTVHTDLFEGVAEVRHVALGQRADLILIAPATAHTLASLAGGLAGDLLGTTVLALGAAKARRKGVDLLVLNRVGWTEGFGTEDNAVIVLDATGVELARVAGDKLSVAHRILDVIP